jgi:hypothetical protein
VNGPKLDTRGAGAPTGVDVPPPSPPPPVKPVAPVAPGPAPDPTSAPATPPGRARWERPVLVTILGATAVLYLWGLSGSGWGNSFYSAASQAGSVSWKAWLFGSSDAANSITVDKPPASLPVWVCPSRPSWRGAPGRRRWSRWSARSEARTYDLDLPEGRCRLVWAG